MRVKTLNVLQEQWRARGDFDDNFYAFFHGEISPTYAYIFPKNKSYVLGIPIPGKHFQPVSKRIQRFKDWLAEEFAFKPLFLKKRESWAIPYGFVLEGKGDIILVGDAAGFCNPLSGEGIRLAIESGIAVGSAVQEAVYSNRPLVTAYKKYAEWIADFVKQVYRFVIGLKDEDREDFVKLELARVSLT
jgi:flavin-dependent dehydrogenase